MFAATDDGGFFSCDLREGVSEPLLVIEGDGSDDGDVRRHCRGRIESASHPGFENDDFAPAITEVTHGDGEGDFEKGGVVFPARNEFANGGEMGRGSVVINLDTGNANALGVTDEVGRGEESSAISGGPGNGFSQRTNRSFAIGSRNVDDFGRGRRKGEVFAKETCRLFQAELHPKSLGGVEPVDCLLVVHGAKLFSFRA